MTPDEAKERFVDSYIPVIDGPDRNYEQELENILHRLLATLEDAKARGVWNDSLEESYQELKSVAQA